MSARFGHGLVIGKFYPPHAGHHLLVRTASRLASRVTVVVMASHVESIALERRVAWMREVHARETNVHVTGIPDDLRMDYEDDALWRAHVALMREAIDAVTTSELRAIDAVFTSEPYGDELARRFDARHVAVDVDRSLVPVSATDVRAHPDRSWSYLEPCVRDALATRLVIVGAESTGKTTLAAELAERLRARGGALGLTRWVPELGRDVTIDKLVLARACAAVDGVPVPSMESLVWESDDFIAIARAQVEREGADGRAGGPVLVCDTDAFATGVWHERYLSTRCAEVEAIAARDRDGARRHYLLTHPADVAFVQDGIRDGEKIRDAMTQVFVERLGEAGCSWAWLRGTRQERVERALAAAVALIESGSGLAAPLG